MKKFKVSFRGYDTKEVNTFLDDVIFKLEKIISDSKKKDEILTSKDKTILDLQNELSKYKSLEQTLNSTITTVQANSEKIRLQAIENSDKANFKFP